MSEERVEDVCVVMDVDSEADVSVEVEYERVVEGREEGEREGRSTKREVGVAMLVMDTPVK